MFDWLKRGARGSGLTAIDLRVDGVSLAHVDRSTGGRPRLTACEFLPHDSSDDARLLGQLATRHHLKRTRCTTVLATGDYQLLLTETPEVKPDELKASIRWRIKDLIDFHINDATLDVFDLPNGTTDGKPGEMYAVAARNEAIQKRVDLMTAAGIGLEIIDIPDLAQRNLSALLPEDAAGVAMLALGAQSGLITITRQGFLYLSRPVNLGYAMLRSTDDPARYFDHIVLEVQRSLDYFESHFREAPVRNLVLAPLAEPVPGLIEHLRANLGANTDTLDLARLMDSDVELTSDLQARCFLTIGAALRQEVKAL